MTGPSPGAFSAPFTDISPEVFQRLKIVGEASELDTENTQTLCPEQLNYQIVSELDLIEKTWKLKHTGSITGASSQNCALESKADVIKSNGTVTIRETLIKGKQALSLTNKQDRAVVTIDNCAFFDCETLGVIENYNNIIFRNTIFSNCGDLIIAGAFDSFVFDNCFVIPSENATSLNFEKIEKINRRIRIDKSVFLLQKGSTGINLPSSIDLKDKQYSLFDVVFEGSGQAIKGIQPDDRRSDFSKCTGVESSIALLKGFFAAKTKDGLLGLDYEAEKTEMPKADEFVPVVAPVAFLSETRRFKNTEKGWMYTGPDNQIVDIRIFCEILTDDTRVYKGVMTINEKPQEISCDSFRPASNRDKIQDIKAEDFVTLNYGDVINLHLSVDTKKQSAKAIKLRILAKEV